MRHIVFFVVIVSVTIFCCGCSNSVANFLNKPDLHVVSVRISGQGRSVFLNDNDAILCFEKALRSADYRSVSNSITYLALFTDNNGSEYYLYVYLDRVNYAMNLAHEESIDYYEEVYFDASGNREWERIIDELRR